MLRKSQQLLFPKNPFAHDNIIPFPVMRRKWLCMLCPFGPSKECSNRQIYTKKYTPAQCGFFCIPCKGLNLTGDEHKLYIRQRDLAQRHSLYMGMCKLKKAFFIGYLSAILSLSDVATPDLL